MKKHITLNNEVMLMKDGFYQLDKDLEAVESFLEEVNERLIKFEGYNERMRYMIENGYYYDVYTEYNEKQINEIHKVAHSLVPSYKSYTAVSKFYGSYAVKTRDKANYLETQADRWAIVALYLAEGNLQLALDLVWSFANGFQPATPTYLNAGKARRGEMVSCFLLDVDDSLNSIGFAMNTSMQLSKIGGGVALNLSKLRGRGEPIKEEEGAAKGAMPVAKLLEGCFAYADQMGQRKGAGAVYYNIFGWDVIELLDSKKINADEGSRLKTLSLGLIIPDKFMELAEKGQPFHMFAPYSVYKEYGVHLDDMKMDEMYEELVNNPRIKKRSMSAREMLTKIAVTQLESGYPYIMFKDTANKAHALKLIGEVKMSNLCTEIFQLQETSIITDYGKPDIINRDINCNLGSINIHTAMHSKDLRKLIHVSVDSLTSVSDKTSVDNAPTVRKANDELHAIGLGAMNLQGYLMSELISYQGNVGRDFARTFFMMLNFYSLERSMLIAKERGETFKDFDKSEYANGNYFDMYLAEDFTPTTERVKELFKGHYVPTIEDWKQLKADVQKYGIYHAYRLAIAPTQSISYIQHATSSVLPIADLIEIRTYSDSTTYYPAPFLSPRNKISYTTAFNMNQYRIIDMVAEIQRHIDQGISTILYVDSNTPTNELVRYYLYAHKKGLKSLYYTRNKLLSVEECTSCAV